MNPPVYLDKPVEDIETLAQILEISPDRLYQLAQNTNHLYWANKPKLKPGGGVRQTYTVKPPLKCVHRMIKTKIFYAVYYPLYLQGSVKDSETPRSYITNAALHSGKRIVINEDIDNFFPSIQRHLVMKMWTQFFHFPISVATILAELTTYRGFVPQGAPTSSYIATLVFWDKEPELEFALRKQGYTYSRLVDDISVSTSEFTSKEDQQKITSQIYAMLFSAGVKPNRKKRSIRTNNQRMTVNKRNVNSTRPTYDKKERAKIRASVRECEIYAEHDRSSEEYIKQFNATFGRVTEMSKCHPIASDKYRKRLESIRPVR